MKTDTSRRTFLKKTLLAGCSSALLPWVSLRCASSGEYDLIIRGGSIIDGSGAQPFAADIGVRNARIAAVGDLSGAAARTVLEAQGRIVAPGFIDIHSHTDSGILRCPGAESKIRQGVTLDVGGNCGGSPFPRHKPGSEEAETAGTYTNFRDFAGRLRESSFALNTGMLAGHAAIRSCVLGGSAREPDEREMALMKDLLRQALEQGAAGMSTGLEYTPGGYAKPDEIIALCRVVAAYGRIYATHIRSEDSALVEAVDEAIHTARESGVSLQISHLKAAGKPNWKKLDIVIELIEKARGEGINVHCDRYPYLAYSTGLGFFFPGWAQEGGGGAFRERLKNAADRNMMKSETAAKVKANGGWESVMIAGVKRVAHKEFLGRRIGEIARSRRKDPYDFVCDLLTAEEGGVSIVGYGMSEDNTGRVIALPYTMIASDGYATTAEAAMAGGVPHPRSFGTFPRAIRQYVREKKLVTLPDMIRKMTALPADKLGLKDRGRIQKNAFADLVAFDPDTITDTATYLEPWRYPRGIDHVVVNGSAVIQNGTQTADRPGRLVTAGQAD